MELPVQIRAPNEFQGTIIGDVNRRKGVIQNSEAEAEDVVVEAQVPLSDMFGYSTGLRSMTQVNAAAAAACAVLESRCFLLRAQCACNVRLMAQQPVKPCAAIGLLPARPLLAGHLTLGAWTIEFA